MAAGEFAQGIGAVAAGLAFIAIGSAFGALIVMGAHKISADETGLETFIPEGMKADARSSGGGRRKIDAGLHNVTRAHSVPVSDPRTGRK